MSYRSRRSMFRMPEHHWPTSSSKAGGACQHSLREGVQRLHGDVLGPGSATAVQHTGGYEEPGERLRFPESSLQVRQLRVEADGVVDRDGVIAGALPEENFVTSLLEVAQIGRIRPRRRVHLNKLGLEGRNVVGIGKVELGHEVVVECSRTEFHNLVLVCFGGHSFQSSWSRRGKVRRPIVPASLSRRLLTYSVYANCLAASARRTALAATGGSGSWAK